MDTPPAQVTSGRNLYVAPTAYVGGSVVFGDDCTVMHQATVRGDLAPIRIGHRVNTQDGAILHTDIGVPLAIEDDVAIGHRAVVHCRSIGAGTLVGIGAIILDECEVGRQCIIAAGAVLTPGTRVPDGKVVMGIPGVPVRDVGDADREYMRQVVQTYVDLGRLHAAGRFPDFRSVRP